MSDKLERTIEVILSLGVTGVTFYALFGGYLTGQQAVWLIISSFAIYQSTSVAKIMKNL